MNRVFCFGEILWDVLPKGAFLGGAPLNVAFHLRQLGLDPAIVSAVGHDALGDEAVTAIKDSGVDVSDVARHDAWPTGTAMVTLDACGQASYRFPRSVAWDEIPVDAALAGPAPAALVFGTLALRTAANRQAVRRLIDAFPDAWIVCDLNLRAPYDDLSPLAGLIAQADLIKVNADEARALAGESARNEDDVIHALQERFRECAICLTLGADGAMVADERIVWRMSSPRVDVVDTIGAGDAFTAGLIAGRLSRVDDHGWNNALETAVRVGAFVASHAGAQPPHERESAPAHCS